MGRESCTSFTRPLRCARVEVTVQSELSGGFFGRPRVVEWRVQRHARNAGFPGCIDVACKDLIALPPGLGILDPRPERLLDRFETNDVNPRVIERHSILL